MDRELDSGHFETRTDRWFAEVMARVGAVAPEERWT